MSGKLVGINTSILTRSGGSNGIGFAIPADLVAAFVAQARDGRTRFARPWAGLRSQAMEADMLEAFGVDVAQGVIISSLHPQSPFARADLQSGDVIVRVAGRTVNSPSELQYRMDVARLGDPVEIAYLRAGEERQTTVDLIEAPDEPSRDEAVLGREALLRGMWIMRVNPSVIEEFGLPLEARGILVADPERIGSRAGFRKGDVIEAINGEAVEHPSDVVRLFVSGAGRYAVTVLRNSRRVLVQFRS
jgi:S1-C subfamily serine protease